MPEYSPIYTTGRRRTLEWAGTVSGSYTVPGSLGFTEGTHDNFRLNAPFNNAGITPTPGTMNIEGVDIWTYLHHYADYYELWPPAERPGWVGAIVPPKAYYALIFNDGMGGSEIAFLISTEPPDDAGNYFGSFTANYLITADVEECYQIQWPWLSSTETRLTFFERLRVGGAVTASVGTAGIGSSITVPINISYQRSFGQQVGYNFLTSLRSNIFHGTYDTSTGSDSQVSPDRTLQYNGIYRTFDQPFPGAPVALKVSGNADPSPTLVDVSTDGSGDYSGVFTQSLGEHISLVNGSVVSSSSVNEWTPAQVKDPTGDTVPHLHGKHFPAFTLFQPPSIVVDVCDSLTGWAAGPNTAISVNGDGWLQAVVSGGPGSLTKTFGAGGPSWDFSGVDLGCYRYMGVDVVSTPVGGPVTLSIPIAVDPGRTPDIGYPAKEWAWRAGGLHQVDLMLPTWPSYVERLGTDGQTHRVQVDSTDTRYRDPWDGPGHIWGVAGAASLTLKGLAPGTYVFRGITQFRQEYSRLDILESSQIYHGNPVKEFFEGELRNCFGGVRLLLGNTDGHQSLEGFGTSTLIHNPDYPLPVDAVAGDGSITALLARIALMPGWVVTDLAPADPFYNNYNHQPGVDWLHGTGMLWTPGDGWTTFLQRDVSSPVTINCQPVFDTIEFYPGIGDPFYNDGTYDGDGVFPARFHWQGLGLFYGMIANEPDGPAVGDHAHPRSEIPSLPPVFGDYGLGTADVEGYFRTVSPFLSQEALANDWYWIQVDEFPDPTDFLYATFPGVYITMSDLRIYHKNQGNDRNMFAAYFRSVPSLLAGLNPWNYVDELGQYHHEYSSHGVILHSRSDTTMLPFSSTDAPAVSTGTAHESRTIMDGLKQIKLFTDTGGVWEIYSTDDGATWSTPVMSFAGGRHGHIFKAEDGTVVRSAYVPNVSSGGGSLVLTNETGDGVSSPYTAVDTTGTPLVLQDDVYGIIQAPEGPERWLGHFAIYGETGTSDWESTDYGQSWQRSS